MKKSKLLSFVLSGIMAVTAVGTVTAGAEEAETKIIGTYNINDVSAEDVWVTTDIQNYEEYLDITEPVSMLLKDYYDSRNISMGQHYRIKILNGATHHEAKASARAKWDYIQKRTALGDTVTYYPHLWKPEKVLTGFTLEELEAITEPVVISAFEHYMLFETTRIREMYAQYRELGDEIFTDETTRRRFQQKMEELKSVEEAGYEMIVTPGESFVSFEDEDYAEGINTYDALLTGTSGTFESGVTYRFNEETKGLFFEGSGQLEKSDFDAAFDTFNFNFMYFGKDVVLPDDYEGTEFNPVIGWTMRDENNQPHIPIYTHIGSNFAKEYESSLNYLCRYVEDIDTAMTDLKEQYTYYTIGTNYDLDTIVHERDDYKLNKTKSETNFIVELDTLTFARYSYYYTDGGGTLVITAQGEKVFTVEQVVEAVKHLDIDDVLLLSDTECYPDELAAFETKEEAEAYLLECINNSKKPTYAVTIDPTYMTILGDIDLNDDQGIADVVALTKYNTSPELFPISEKTALANADMNQDGKIDALDTAILIEMTIGGFESAV